MRLPMRLHARIAVFVLLREQCFDGCPRMLLSLQEPHQMRVLLPLLHHPAPAAS
jgi:hypothetical protein